MRSATRIALLSGGVIIVSLVGGLLLLGNSSGIAPVEPPPVPDCEGPGTAVSADVLQGQLLVTIKTEPPGIEIPWGLEVVSHSKGGEPPFTREEQGSGPGILALPAQPFGELTLLLKSPQAVGDIKRAIPFNHEGLSVTMTLRQHGAVSGRVHGTDGSLIPDVNVVLIPQVERFGHVPPPLLSSKSTEPIRVLTDANGEFEVPGLIPGPGTYFLGAVKAGYRAARHGLVTVLPGSVSDFDIFLEPGARIEGTLLRPDGSPATGVSLTVSEAHHAESAIAGWTVEGESHALHDGSFTFDGLSGGYKKVRAQIVDNGITHLVQVVSECRAGETTDLGCIKPRPGSLRLIFRTLDNTGLRRLRVRLIVGGEHAIQAPWIFYVFPEGGADACVGGLPPGTVRLLVADESVYANAQRRPILQTSLDFSGNDDVATVELPALEDPAPVGTSGPVRGPLELALEGMKRGASLVLVQSGSDITYVLPPVLATDGTRTLRIQGLPRGELRVIYLADGRFIDRRVEADSGGAPVRLAPEEEGVVLSVCVRRSGESVRGAEVLFRPVVNGVASERILSLGKTDVDGRLRFAGFPPGSNAVLEVGLGSKVVARRDVTMLLPETTVDVSLGD